MLIIHTADNHLDAPLSSLPPEISAKRKADRRASFSKIIDYTIEKNADCLLISGDLSDSPVLSHSLSSFLKGEFTRLGAIPVFIALGNHDYGLSQNNFPGNVHIFSNKAESFSVGEGTITGISFCSKTASLEKLIPPCNKSPAVLCMHGDFSPCSEYNPLNKDFLSTLGYSYVALGHVHEFYRDKVFVYPGCHDGAGFDEEGEKGFVCANINSYSTDISFIPTSSAIYKVINLDVSDFSSVHDIVAALEDSVAGCICKVKLSGKTCDTLQIDINYILSFLSPKAKYIKIIDETCSEDFSQSRILKEFSKIISQENEKISSLASKYALLAMKGVDFDL